MKTIYQNADNKNVRAVVVYGKAADHKLYSTLLPTAPTFSTSATYAVGDKVDYNGALYECKVAVTTAGSWTNTTNWTAKDYYVGQISEAEFIDLAEKNMLLIAVGNEFVRPVSFVGNKAYTIVRSGLDADEFDATDTYSVGDKVTKDGVPYVCSTAIQSAAAWDASKWTEIISADLVAWEAKAAE